MKTTQVHREHFIDGMYAFINEKYDESINQLSNYIEKEPDDTTALLTRGSAYLKLNRTDDAVRDFETVIQNDPEHARAYHMRGLAREQSGNDEEAVRDFQRAIDLNPEYGAAYYSHANAMTKMGDEESALEDIRMVTHLTHLNVERYANENNVWRSDHMRVENAMETDLNR